MDGKSLKLKVSSSSLSGDISRGPGLLISGELDYEPGTSGFCPNLNCERLSPK
jgi:hypothetical protein